MTKRGVFILFEGVDRSGKTTQAKLLTEWLNDNGHKAQMLRFPDRTTGIGKMIDNYLKNGSKVTDDRTIHLLFSVNRWEVAPQIKSLLESGVNVVVDRYSFSGIAYSAAKGLDINWCKNADIGLPAPDVVFFMDVMIPEAMRRAGFGQEIYETEVFQEKVRAQFMKLREPSWIIIDAHSPIKSVHEEIRITTVHTIDEYCNTEMKKL